MLLFGFSCLLFLFWLTRIWHLRSRSLRSLPDHYPVLREEKVSLIVAARDEVQGIEANVRSLLAQSYAHLELIVVDDRSQDGTGEVLDRLSKEFPQLKVVHNRDLPQGWLGKCWALHRGAEISHGDWLIFCDGDVIMQPNVVRHALASAQNENYQHLCMAPRLLSKDRWEDTVITSLTFLFYTFQDPHEVFEPHKTSKYMGVGAFNMVQKSLYQAFGGHTALQLEIVDDIFLGMLAKRYGGRSSFFLGMSQASLYWYDGVWAYIRGIEKNSFAGLRFSVSLLLVAILGQTFLFFGPMLLFVSTDLSSKVLLGVSLVIMHGLFAVVCRRSEIPWFCCFGLLPAIIVQFFAFSRSAWITLRQRGVRWRGNFYALSDLRAAQQKLRGPLFSFMQKGESSKGSP